MADLLYTYSDEVYANITNKCNCSCIFCIRNEADAIGNAKNLWHRQEPTLQEIKKAMDDFDFSGYRELVYCGYGEPTCALENLIASARYAKAKFGLPVRINTNGLANLYHHRNVVPSLSEIADAVSISLNAPDEETYQRITRPSMENAFDSLLDFIRECKAHIPEVRMTVVDVLSYEETEKCFRLADDLGVKLRVRGYAD